MGTIRTQTGNWSIKRILATAVGIMALALFAVGCQGESGGDSSGSFSSPLTSSALGDLDSWGGTSLTLEDLDGRLNLTPEQTQPMQDALDKWNESRPTAGEKPRSGQMHGNRRGSRGEGEPGMEMHGGAHLFLIDCAAFLETDQMAGLIEYLKERREEHRQARPEGERGRRPDGRLEGQLTQILEQLELIEDQKTQVTTLFEEHRKAMGEFRSQWSGDNPPDADVRGQMRTLRQEFHESLEAIIGADNMPQLKGHRPPFRREKMDRAGTGARTRTGRSIEFLTAVLHLTEAQQAQIAQVFATAEETRESIRGSVPDSEFPSEDVIGKMEQLRGETDAAVRSILTPGQLQVFEALQGMIGGHGCPMHRP